MIFAHLRQLSVIACLSLAAHGTIVTTAIDEDNGSLTGSISLREAVKYSPAGGTITFAPALSGKTIRLTGGEILIDKSLTIDGSALPSRITLSADRTGNGRTFDDTRVIRITTGTVILDSLVISDGNCPGSTGTQGAGIYVNNSTTKLTVRNSALSSNYASEGAGIYFYGILNTPDSFLQIENSSFTGNSAYNGGAIYTADGTATLENTTLSGNSAMNRGGAIWNYRTFNLRKSTVSDNSAPRGGGIHHSNGNLTVEESSLSNNSASAFGGGIFADGTLNLLNSTLSGNSAITSGGGIYCNIVTASLKNSTVTGNSAGLSNGGIYHNDRSSLTLRNSIVAGNTAPTGSNLFGSFTGSNNLTSGNPFLAPLGGFGGPTRNMPPLPGSPAIDSGSTTTALVTDQRGFSRDSNPDVGAVEYLPAHDLPLVQSFAWALDVDMDGNPYGVEQALGTDIGVADFSNERNPTAPVFNASGHAIVSFGINSAATPGTCWILKRSPDLSSGSFMEIYRYDGVADTAVPGVTFVRTATGVTITDGNPHLGGGFYRFEARLEP